MRNVESSQCNSTNIETINIQVSGNVIFQIYLNHHAITMCGYVFCLHVAAFFSRNSAGFENCRTKGIWQICSGYDMHVFCDCSELRNISQTSACVCACVRVYVEIELM